MSQGVHPNFKVFGVTIPETPERVIPGVTPEHLARFYMAAETDIIARADCLQQLAGIAAHNFLADYLMGNPSPRALQQQLPEVGPIVEEDVLPADAHLRHHIPAWPRVMTEAGEVRVCLVEVRPGLSDAQLAACSPQPRDHVNPDQLTLYEEDYAA